jgi:DNA-binding NtrC family response regulator
VDDVEEICNLESLVLKKNGYDVVFKGKSGEEIVQALVDGRLVDDKVDIALLDYQMGSGIDGLQTAMRIKENIPTVKIIIVSGENKVENEVQMAGLEFLSKPFSIQQFLNLIGHAENDGDKEDFRRRRKSERLEVTEAGVIQPY